MDRLSSQVQAITFDDIKAKKLVDMLLSPTEYMLSTNTHPLESLGDPVVSVEASRHTYHRATGNPQPRYPDF